MSKMPKQAEAKRDGVINQQNYSFNHFKHEFFYKIVYKRI